MEAEGGRAKRYLPLGLRGNDRAWFFAASVSLSLLLVLVVRSAVLGEYLIGFFGYYTISATVIIWAFALWRALQEKTGRVWEGLKWKEIALLVGTSVFVVAFEPWRFKVVMDEPVIAGISYMMHRDRLALLPTRSSFEGGELVLLDGLMNKRPLLLSYLQSLLHDLTGYRIANAIYTNVLLTPWLLLLVYLCGRNLGKSRKIGVLAVFLLATLPITGNLATSGGLGLLAGVCLLLAFFTVLEWRRTGSDRWLSLHLLSLVLLANTRYESGFWIVPFGGYVVFRFWRERRWDVPWALIACPLLMVAPSVQRLTESKLVGQWQPGAVGQEAAFSLGYLGTNIEGAWRFFTSLSHLSPNSYVLFLLMVAGVMVTLGLFIAHIWSSYRGRCEAGESASSRLDVEKEEEFSLMCFFLFGLVGLCAIIFSFNWGYFESFITHRLSFSLHIGGILLICFAMRWQPQVCLTVAALFGLVVATIRLQGMDVGVLLESGIHYAGATVLGGLGVWVAVAKARPERLWPMIVLILGLAFFWHGLPKMANHRWVEAYIPSKMVEASLRFAQSHPTASVLFISGSAMPEILAGHAAAQSRHVRETPLEEILKILRNRRYEEIYYSQLFALDETTGEWSAYFDKDLLPHFPWVEVERVVMRANMHLRFFRMDQAAYLDLHDGSKKEATIEELKDETMAEAEGNDDASGE